MKYAIIAITLLFNSAVFAQSEKFKQVYVTFTDVDAPPIAAPEESIAVAVKGYLQNGCYRWEYAEVKHYDNNLHEVRAVASVNVVDQCVQMIVPFVRELDLGRLAPGLHLLRVVNEDGSVIEKQIEI